MGATVEVDDFDRGLKIEVTYSISSSRNAGRKTKMPPNLNIERWVRGI